VDPHPGEEGVMATLISAQLRDLHGFDSRGSRILSLYLPTSPAEHDTAALLEQVNAISLRLREGLSASERAALDGDLALARDYLSSMIAPPVAVALFASAPRNYFRVVRLPVDVAPAAYWSPLPETGALRRLAERRQEMQYGHGVASTV
jgi:hypothetical protein